MLGRGARLEYASSTPTVCMYDSGRSDIISQSPSSTPRVYASSTPRVCVCMTLTEATLGWVASVPVLLVAIYSLLCMCPQITIYVSSYCYICSLNYCMCPHTTKCVSLYYYICVLVPLYFVRILRCMCPHTALYVSSYYYICVLILSKMHTRHAATTKIKK